MELQPIENAIVIHPNILRKFIKYGKDYANLLALYSFYLYHAQLQKTNQPLATDEFTRKGMNWAIDRVKRVKKILKEMKIIEVVQKERYSYIHLLFIYTKKKIDEILGNNRESEASAPKKPKEKTTIKESKKPIAKASSPILLDWLKYCDNKHIAYGKNNIEYWKNQLKDRLIIDQQKAIYTAINRGWKNFYIVPLKESKYHKFLGKSLRMDRDCDTLLDITYTSGDRYIYQFKNIKVTSTGSPEELFGRYGYTKIDVVESIPIASQVKDKIMGVIKRF